MFTVYALQSECTGRFYIGHTDNVKKRLVYHNSGRTKFPRHRGPWQLVYTEEFATRAEAVRRERQIKRWKSHRYLQRLIEKSSSAELGKLAEPLKRL